jgi:8-hydroxy-5-deazaflavin:NADPH oxidoreductase
MKIGIIGSGHVAQALGKGLIELGHEVMLGTRDTDKKELDWWRKKSHKNASLGSTTEAAYFGETAFLAVSWHAAEDVIAQVRPSLASKIVIDVTNPLVFEEGQAPQLTIGHTMSAGEIVQASLPDSHVVKTLNMVGFEHLIKPKFKQGIPVMFLCGNNESAKTHTASLLKECGWQDIVDLGGIEKSRILEPLSLLWIEYGVANNTWDHAFSVLKA